MYDSTNIFAKIIAGEIPCKKIYENNYALSFYDVNPKAKIHALVVPKGKYTDLHDFSVNATNEEQIGFFQVISNTIKILDLKNGSKSICNTGIDGNQEVLHFHMHILGGSKIKSLI